MGKAETVKVDTLRTRRGRGACLAIIAVLTLLMSPVLAGRAHAAMLEAAPKPMAMTMAGTAQAGSHAAPPCHHDGAAACSIACALASQLLPPTASDAIPPVETSGRANYAFMERSVSEIAPEHSTPPPR